MRLALGLELAPGNIHGGVDGRPLVPYSADPDQPSFHFTLFSMAHGVQVANILLFAGALVPLLALGTVRRWRSRPGSGAKGHDALVFIALGEVGFVYLWNFDLGFPLDLDLMSSMTIVLVLAALDRMLATPAGGRWAVEPLVALAGLVLSGPLLWSSIHPNEAIFRAHPPATLAALDFGDAGSAGLRRLDLPAAITTL